MTPVVIFFTTKRPSGGIPLSHNIKVITLCSSVTRNYKGVVFLREEHTNCVLFQDQYTKRAVNCFDDYPGYSAVFITNF